MTNPWVLASRPKTLFAGIAPVLTGIGVAVYRDTFALGPAIAALFGAILIQVGANFANDLADFQKGADTVERLGPLRVTQAGLLTPRQVLGGMWLCFGLASVLGVYLISVAGWPVILIGLLSIVAGLAYTGGPIPLGYHGLGDLMVFVFFGPTAVAGTYYVQALQVDSLVAWISIPIGALATAILVVNNLRDIRTDKEAGKITLAVRLGERGTRLEYSILVIGAFGVLIGMILAGLVPPSAALTLLSLPLAVTLIRRVYSGQGKELNPILGRTGQLELLYTCLFMIGLNL